MTDDQHCAAVVPVHGNELRSIRRAMAWARWLALRSLGLRATTRNLSRPSAVQRTFSAPRAKAAPAKARAPTAPDPTPPPSSSSRPQRLGLDELRAAARQRRGAVAP